MIFVPAYTVSYKGRFYLAGQPVQIDAKDKEEMSRHGRIETESTLPLPEEKPVKEMKAAPKAKRGKAK